MTDMMNLWNVKYAKDHGINQDVWGSQLLNHIEKMDIAREIKKLKKADTRVWQVVFNGVFSILRNPLSDFPKSSNEKFIEKMVNQIGEFLIQLVEKAPKGLKRPFKQFRIQVVKNLPLEDEIIKHLNKLPFKITDDFYENIVKEWNLKIAFPHEKKSAEWAEHLIPVIKRLDIPFQILRLQGAPFNLWQNVFDGLVSILMNGDINKNTDTKNEDAYLIISNILDFMEQLISKAPNIQDSSGPEFEFNEAVLEWLRSEGDSSSKDSYSYRGGHPLERRATFILNDLPEADWLNFNHLVKNFT